MHPPKLGAAILGGVFCALVTLLLAREVAEEPSARDVAVTVDRIAIDNQNAPVVVLEEQGGLRWLPIWIGPAEARSIALQIADHPPLRPNSHDLVRSLVRELEGEVARVVITDLRGGTYYARLHVSVGEETLTLDARPSDAIAIALRDDAPVFVRARLFEQVGRASAGEAPEPEIDEEIERRI